MRNGTRNKRFEYGNVVNRVNRFHGIGETECEGLRTNFVDDFKRSEVFFGEFARGTGGAEELCFDEDLLTDLEVRRRFSTGIRRSLVSLLRDRNLLF